jgi:hypothetical protein
MAVYYYIAPWVPLFAKGDGKFGLTEPGRPTSGSKCMIYGQWDQNKGTRCSIVPPFNQPNSDRRFCLTRVEGPDSLHEEIQKDIQITSITPKMSNLDTDFGKLDEANKSKIKEKLDALRIDASEINDSTKIKEIIINISKTVLLARTLGNDYPNIDLNSKFSSVSFGQRLRLINFLRNKNIKIDDVTTNTSIRDLTKKLKQIRIGKITIGPDKIEE